MKVYTKTGDAGETSLYGGKRVRKSELRLSAYGTVDELNAVLGVVLAQPNVEIYQESLHKIQNDLFTLGSELASASAEVAQNLPKVEEARIEELEKQIERIDKAYSMRATDVWLTHNTSPHDYLCKEISEALYGTGE